VGTVGGVTFGSEFVQQLLASRHAGEFTTGPGGVSWVDGPSLMAVAQTCLDAGFGVDDCGARSSLSVTDGWSTVGLARFLQAGTAVRLLLAQESLQDRSFDYGRPVRSMALNCDAGPLPGDGRAGSPTVPSAQEVAVVLVLDRTGFRADQVLDGQVATVLARTIDDFGGAVALLDVAGLAAA
jgi:hypothetical protein